LDNGSQKSYPRIAEEIERTDRDFEVASDGNR
jgi:hypothetical protein